MQRLNLLRNALRAGGLFPKPSQITPVLLTRGPARCFSTDGPEEQAPSPDPFLQRPTKGLVYGKLTGIGRNTLKTDVIHYFEGCNLATEDVKVHYSRSYTALGMLSARKGRLYWLEKIDRSQWDQCTTYDGKAVSVLLEGIPRNAAAEDIERFLCGCNFDASTLQTFIRPGFPDPIRLSLVHFPSQIEAMNAYRVKNRGFCLNNPITMRVLQ